MRVCRREKNLQNVFSKILEMQIRFLASRLLDTHVRNSEDGAELNIHYSFGGKKIEVVDAKAGLPPPLMMMRGKKAFFSILCSCNAKTKSCYGGEILHSINRAVFSGDISCIKPAM